MAEALLGVVAEEVFSKALSLATQEISGALGVREDLETLAEELELIQALLADAERKSSSSGLVQLWLERLEAAAADADNLLDEFAYEVLRKKMQKGKKEKVRSFFSSSNPLIFRFKMASKIKTINSRMDGIFQKSTRIGLRSAAIANYAVDLKGIPLTDPFIDDSETVGRVDDVQKIVSQLTSLKDEKDLAVIGVVGMAGQGKTRIAKLLFGDDIVMNHFEKTIWTCVSDDFNVEKILKDMLQSLTAEDSPSTNRQALVGKLQGELQGKRFLLVLDDVWNEDSGLWGDMNRSLRAICGSKESRILVTTRNERVVSMMNGFVYSLGKLSREASQKLFENIAFGNGKAAETWPKLVEIGKRIVERCGGVPLAVKAVGSLMSSKRDELEWQKIEESRMWNISDGVLSAIELSFDHLPSLSLKQCFAYCSVFPEDWIIERKELIQLWMAQGLLNPSRGSGMEMEDVGNNYFDILLQRSLLQEAEIDEFGNIITCKMHDLVHEFALKASKGRCWTIEDRQHTFEDGQLTDDINAIHLSVVADKRSSLNISEKNFSRLRTLILYGGFSFADFLVHCKCKYLRVLFVDDMRMKELPNSIAKLKHLRYLDISSTPITILPNFITKLYNLQTLRLPKLKELPKDFGSMVNLRHLYISMPFGLMYLFPRSSDYCLIRGIRQLASLRTLSFFVVSEDKGCQIEELSFLKDLEGSIRILGLQNVANRDDATKANLSRKMNLESLELCWDPNTGDGSRDQDPVLEGLQPHLNLKALKIENFMGKTLPSWVADLRKLVNINLENLYNCDKVPALGHLPCLKVVKIYNMSSVKCIGDEFYGWNNLASAHSSQTPAPVFPKLRELTFAFMSSLDEWSDAVHPSVQLFPCLKKLKIESCPNLIHLPKNLSDLTGLESLKIDICDKLVSFPHISRLCSLNQLQVTYCHSDGFGSNDEDPVLEGLRPHLNLKSLKIKDFMSWMADLHNLVNIKLQGLDKCDRVPALGHLPFLKVCEINGMRSVKSIGEEFYGWTNFASEHSSQISAVVFPSLGELTFECMSSLDEWSDAVHPSSFSSVKLFPRLEKLNVEWCPSLTHLPGFLNNLFSVRHLTFRYCGSMSHLPGNLSDLTGLESLEIDSCSKLVSFPDISRLRSLNELRITNCPELPTLTCGIEACKLLRTLHIPCPASLTESILHNFTNLTSLTLHFSENNDYMPFEPISNSNIQQHNPFATLHALTLIEMPELKSLPEHFQHLTALRELSLKNCDELKALPEWLANFHSICSLSLINCKSLKSFPSAEVMQGLRNLGCLWIMNCPILKQRCTKGSSEEWHKIAHIPDIVIDFVSQD